jgi:hypothetical protein
MGPVATVEHDRVRSHTAAEVLQQSDEQTRENVRRYASASDEAVEQRIVELEREWDIERVLELNAASLALSGVLAGLRSRRVLALPIVVLGFLIQHAVQGWCPPIALFRRLGVRTRREIDAEKQALRVLRGDFDHVAGRHDRERVESVLDGRRDRRSTRNARSRTLAGRVLHAAGDDNRPADELAAAAEVLDACGAIRYRDEAERELRRVGSRDHRRRGTRRTVGDGSRRLRPASSRSRATGR